MYAYQKQFWGFFWIVFFFYMWRYVHCPVFKIYCKSSIISLHSINICKIRELFMPVSKFLKRIEYPHLLGKIKCREFLLNQSFGKKNEIYNKLDKLFGLQSINIWTYFRRFISFSCMKYSCSLYTSSKYKCHV